MPAPPASGDARAGASGDVPGTGGTRAASSFAPSADSGPSHAITAAADAADLGPLPSADSGAIDSGSLGGLACAGVYKGNFNCVTQTIGNAPSDPIAVALTLQPLQGAETASASAPLSFTFYGFVFAGDIRGQLDCRTNAFHADIVNGITANELAPIPLSFEGTIDGELDRATGILAGDWSFYVPGAETCAGKWNAALQ